MIDELNADEKKALKIVLIKGVIINMSPVSKITILNVNIQDVNESILWNGCSYYLITNIFQDISNF